MKIFLMLDGWTYKSYEVKNLVNLARDVEENYLEFLQGRTEGHL
ncbi:hypothetical protein [Rossellomorea marisflavi]|nr:hypothetical protein [Rossellomorea marisflavi]